MFARKLKMIYCEDEKCVKKKIFLKNKLLSGICVLAVHKLKTPQPGFPEAGLVILSASCHAIAISEGG